MKKDAKICDEYCERCIYYQNSSLTCNYIFFEERPRGCEPGTGCNKRMTRAEYLKRMKISLQPVVTAKSEMQKSDARKNRGKFDGGKIGEEENARRLKLYESGLSDGQIGKIVGVARGSITSWRKCRNLSANFDATNLHVKT